MGERSKRAQAKRKLVPIVEKALDPLGRDTSGSDYLAAIETAEEIIDLIFDGVKEEVVAEIKKAGYVRGFR